MRIGISIIFNTLRYIVADKVGSSDRQRTTTKYKLQYKSILKRNKQMLWYLYRY
jgi:hypothetical protein